jgi:hypothetical protein
MDSGIVHSDYKCSDLLQQQYTMRDWAQIVVSPFGAMDAKDSLFYFTWSIDLHSPSECDSALTLQDWMRSELRSRRQEYMACASIALVSGIRDHVKGLYPVQGVAVGMVHL